MQINYCAPINSTGYGISSLNIFRELNKDNDIVFFPIGQPVVTSQLDHEALSTCLNKRMIMNVSAPFVKIWHQFDLLERIGKGQYIAMPFFELDTFNPFEKLNMTVPDKICVTSKWAQNVLAANNINTTSCVVPLGVDRLIFNENIEKDQEYNTSEKYIFLNIGKWEIRKGHDILLDIFNKAFPDNNDVELWIVASETTNNYSSKEELDQWKNMYNVDRVRVFSGFETQEEIAQIMANADCGIYPSRAEGWNLELLEMMSMNKPVIATNYSSHTEFCNKDNTYLVDIDSTETAYDGKAFRGQGNWAKISSQQIDQIIEHMRYVYNNKINTNLAGIETAKKYSWANSAEHLLRCISS